MLEIDKSGTPNEGGSQQNVLYLFNASVYTLESVPGDYKVGSYLKKIHCLSYMAC